jgi:hypothetical protein
VLYLPAFLEAADWQLSFFVLNYRFEIRIIARDAMNQKMLELLGEHADKYPKHIEQDFPHVFSKLLELWGTSQMRGYLDDLMMSKRPGRLGFPDDAAAEVWALSSAYSRLHPTPETDSPFDDLWSHDADAARDAWKEITHSHKPEEG